MSLGLVKLVGFEVQIGTHCIEMSSFLHRRLSLFLERLEAIEPLGDFPLVLPGVRQKVSSL